MSGLLSHALLLRAAAALEEVAHSTAERPTPNDGQRAQSIFAHARSEWKDAQVLRGYVRDQRRVARKATSRTLRGMR